jgi:P-type Ca2+ transporter type 2C
VIQDSFAALALATEEPSEYILKREPIKKKMSIITPFMWQTIVVQSVC